MNKLAHNWYTIENAEEIDSPALVIFPERVKENIRMLKSMIGDPERLRPHVKTHKTKQVIQLMIEAGIHKFKCATIAEGEMLGMCKAKDALLAYQPTGPKLSRFVELINTYKETKFSCLTDNIDSAKSISEIALRNSLVISIYIDINIGMNRTGIAPGNSAIQLFNEVNGLEGIQVLGLHAYDGHIKRADLQERTQACNVAFAPVELMIENLRKQGFDKLQVIAGGSPTYSIHAKRENVNCSPGTFVYWDKGYQDTVPEQSFLPAALVVTRIISIPDKDKLCLDLGYKSISSENDLNQRAYFLNAPDLKIIMQSEEHMVVETAEGHSWKIGDMLYVLPFHICPTCALYDSASIIEDRQWTGFWKIVARDRKITI